MKLGTMDCATGSMHSFAVKLLLRPEASLSMWVFLIAYLSCHETFESPLWGLQSIQRFWEKMQQLPDFLMSISWQLLCNFFIVEASQFISSLKLPDMKTCLLEL